MEDEKVRRKKISTAMILGAKVTKRMEGEWYERRYSSREKAPAGQPLYAACAMGAAIIGAHSPNGLEVPSIGHDAYTSRTWPWMMEVELKDIPVELWPEGVTGHHALSLEAVVTRLNDEFHWSRTRIAAWLKKVEKHLGIREDLFMDLPTEFDAPLVK